MKNFERKIMSKYTIKELGDRSHHRQIFCGDKLIVTFNCFKVRFEYSFEPCVFDFLEVAKIIEEEIQKDKLKKEQEMKSK